MPGAKNFFSPDDQETIVNAIREAELKTSGEIRVHLENFCFGNELNAAKKVFLRLKMHQTKERNAVLIYLAVRSRKIAVFGDEGIHQKLGEVFWEEIVKDIIAGFKSNEKAKSLAIGISRCGEQLGKYFPRLENDQDELSNAISY
jgi:uncharacterized membrane protein